MTRVYIAGPIAGHEDGNRTTTAASTFATSDQIEDGPR